MVTMGSSTVGRSHPGTQAIYGTTEVFHKKKTVSLVEEVAKKGTARYTNFVQSTGVGR